MFVNDDICSVHSRLSTIITVSSMGVSGACACRVAYCGRYIMIISPACPPGAYFLMFSILFRH